MAHRVGRKNGGAGGAPTVAVGAASTGHGHRPARYHRAMTTTTPESRARIAYTAYGRKVDFKNFQGDPMPVFDALPEQIREAWINAARVIWELGTTGTSTL